MFEPCEKTGRKYKLSEADGIENITTACIRHVHDKVTCNCVTNYCMFVMHNQAGTLYSNSLNLCTRFPWKCHSLYISFNMWLSLICMLHSSSSFISLWFLPKLDALTVVFFFFFWSTWFSCEFSAPSHGTFLERYFSWFLCDLYVTCGSQPKDFFLRHKRGLH